VTSSDVASGALSSTIVQRFFTTASTFQGNLMSGDLDHAAAFADGLTGADYRCQYFATQNSLTGVWRAVIGDNTIAARDRLLILGKVTLVNGTTLANSDSDFWDAAVPVAPQIGPDGATLS